MDQMSLRLLALDAGWRSALAALDETLVDDLEQCTGPPRSVRSSGHPPRAPVGTSYAAELRRLINDEFEDAPAIVGEALAPRASMEDRIRSAAHAHAVAPTTTSTEDYARRSAWSTTLVGPGLLAITEPRGGQPRARQAYVDEVLASAGCLAIPPRLARHLTVVLERLQTHRSWALAVLQRLEAIVSRCSDGPDAPGAFIRCHLDARLEIARAVRMEEVVHPELLASLELTAMSALIRTAGTRDIARAWGRTGAARAAVAEFERVNDSGELLSEQALRAVVRPPGASWFHTLGAADQDAVRFAAAVRRRPAGPERGILLYDPWIPDQEGLP
jgi:hypothetical protein